MRHTAPITAAKDAFPLLWCAACNEHVEAEVHTNASLQKVGDWLFYDVQSGCDVFRVREHLLATNTDYCPYCDAILSDFDPVEAWHDAREVEDDNYLARRGASYSEQVSADYRAMQMGGL